MLSPIRSTWIFHVLAFNKKYLLLPIVLEMKRVDEPILVNTIALKMAFYNACYPLIYG